MRKLFFLIALALFFNCFEFQEMNYSINFKKQTIHMEYALPYCYSCIDSCIGVDLTEGREKEFSKYSKSDIRFFSSLLLFDAAIQKGDSLFFKKFIKSSIGNISYHLTSKKILKTNGGLHCIFDAKMDIDWVNEENIKRYILNDIIKNDIVAQRGELIFFQDTAYLYSTNSDYEINTNKNHLFIWNVQDSIINIKMTKKILIADKNITFDSYYNNKGELLANKIPKVFFKDYDPLKLLNGIFKDSM